MEIMKIIAITPVEHDHYKCSDIPLRVPEFPIAYKRKNIQLLKKCIETTLEFVSTNFSFSFKLVAKINNRVHLKFKNEYSLGLLLQGR